MNNELKNYSIRVYDDNRLIFNGTENCTSEEINNMAKKLYLKYFRKESTAQSGNYNWTRYNIYRDNKDNCVTVEEILNFE
jgi:hypothetical protein